VGVEHRHPRSHVAHTDREHGDAPREAEPPPPTAAGVDEEDAQPARDERDVAVPEDRNRRPVPSQARCELGRRAGVDEPVMHEQDADSPELDATRAR